MLTTGVARWSSQSVISRLVTMPTFRSLFSCTIDSVSKWLMTISNYSDSPPSTDVFSWAGYDDVGLLVL